MTNRDSLLYRIPDEDTKIMSLRSGRLPVLLTFLNQGFETAGVGGNGNVWADWVGAVSDGSLDNETTIVHEGSDAAKLTSGSAINTHIRQTTDTSLVLGMRYYTVFYARGDGVNGGMYGVYSPEGWIISKVTTGITGAVWERLLISFTANRNGTHTLYLYCSPIDGGVCYYDI